MNRQVPYLLVGTLLTLLLQSAAVSLGPAAVLISFVVPFPAAFSHMRLGAGVGGGIVLLSTATLLVSGGIGAAAWYFLFFGLGSFILPFLLRRNQGWDRAVALTLLAVLGTGVLAVGGYALHREVELVEVIRQYIGQEVEKALIIYQEADLPEEQLAELRRMAPEMARFLVLAWPALVVVFSAAVILLQVRFLAGLAPGRYDWPGPAFHRWKAPEQLIWPLIVAGFGALLGDGLLRTVSLNLVAVLLPVYFLQGLAVLAFFFRRKGFSLLLRTLGYTAAVLLNPFPLIVTGLGVFDLWADFRKPRVKK